MFELIAFLLGKITFFAGSVLGNNSFPKPLSQEEEAEEVRKMQAGDSAARCIENEILMYLRRISRLRGEVSLDEPLNVDWEGNELLLSDVLGTDNDVVYKGIESDVEKEMLSVAISKLSPREREIMDMRFGFDGGEEMTQKEVADKLGISQSYISRLEKKIVLRLKKEFKKLS